MADDASYAAFLERANRPTKSTVSSSETTSVDEPVLSKRHPYLPLLNNKLAGLSDKTFVTESDSDFIATFISSSSLPSWTDIPDKFPAASDLEGQVEGGRNGKSWSVEEWDTRNEYSGVINAVKDTTQHNALRVYTIQGRGGRFEVFILAKMDDGLVGVKAQGVET